MRTKTLLLTAALTAAGALTSTAQVYSVNMVGYINLTIQPKKFALVANQLNNTVNGVTDNSIGALIPNPPNGTLLEKWDTTTKNFSIQTAFHSGAGGWGDPTITLVPANGDVALIYNAGTTAFTLTF